MRRFALFVAVSGSLLAACTSNSDPFGLKPISSPLPLVAGNTVQGGTASSADLRGQILVVNFWAQWCAPCLQEQPELERTWRRYHDRGVTFLGVDYRDDTSAARAWVKRFGVSYPSVQDPSGKLANAFALIGVPDTFVVDRTGTIRWKIIGKTNEAQLSKLLDQLLAASP
jgi:cytochrome c biogenesis protein CcmG/thiol:disulfide interchange protein DsbE